MTTTVFFHPRFFLDMMDLTPDELERVAGGLDERRLSPVLSRELLVQLLTGSDDPAAGRRVAEAIMLLSADSPGLEAHLSWGMLAVGGDDRRALAADLRRQGRVAERLNRAIAETGLETLGLSSPQAQGAVAALLPLLKQAGVDIADAPDPVGPDLRAMGMRATDARRMGELLLHADRIQAYQLTADQLDRLHALADAHPLARAGLSGACFVHTPGHPAAALTQLDRVIEPRSAPPVTGA